MSNVKLPVLDTGVPGVTGPAPTDFNSFYVFYLTQHLHPRTRLSHVIGMTLGWLAVLAAALLARPWLLLGLPVFGYAGAIPSHYIWERNRPASLLGFRMFVWSIGGDLRQLARFYIRRLDSDVAAVRAALGLRADQMILADAPELSPPNRHLTAAGGNSL
jgi:hypothetical protein